MTIDREQVTQALRDVFDPELGMSVVDLGMIYDVQIDTSRVRITMTLTTQGCPLHDGMADWVREAVAKVPGVEDVAVAITFEPPWTPDRIGQDALLARPYPGAAAPQCAASPRRASADCSMTSVIPRGRPSASS